MSKTKALIYCRVSSEKQVSEGAGLHSQETKCRSYAKEKGYKVEKVFHDKAISGALQDRPAIRELLKFITESKEIGLRLIVDDVSRLARDVQIYFNLKTLFLKANTIIESPNHNFFEDTPENKLMETISVSMAEFERNKNKQRVKDRMKARLEDGYWPFRGVPKCFKLEKTKSHGKVIVKTKLAPVYKEALEGFAYERFQTIVEANKYLNQFVKIEYTKFCDLLRNPLICGYIEYSKWGVSWRKANHEGIIDFEVYERIQDKLNNKKPNQVNVKTKLNEDFPLRGFVKCLETESKFTGGWSKNGSGKRVPYYQSRVTRDQRINKGFRSRSFQRDKVHNELEEVLETIKPGEGIIKLLRVVFEDVWTTSQKREKEANKDNRKRVIEIENEIESLIGRITKASNETVISRYETKIEDLENELKQITTKLDQNKFSKERFQTALNNCEGFLNNPHIYWKHGNLEAKKMVLKLCFQDYLFYSQKSGFQTPSLSLPFKVFRQLKQEDLALVDISKNYSNQFVKWCIDWEKVVINLLDNLSLDLVKKPLNKENNNKIISPR